MNRYRMTAPKVETKAKGDRTLTEVIASTAAPDRMGDVVEQSWHLDRYERNPVILWGHNPSIPPIGRSVSTSILGEGHERSLVTAIEWDEGEHNPLATTVAAQFRSGMLNAVSVGFVPSIRVARSALEEDDPSYSDDPRAGYLLRDNELLEVSAVSIPANPEALVVGRAVSVDIPADDIAEHVRKAVEEMLRETLSKRVREQVSEAIRADARIRAAIEGIVLASTLSEGGDLNQRGSTAPPLDWFAALK